MSLVRFGGRLDRLSQEDRPGVAGLALLAAVSPFVLRRVQEIRALLRLNEHIDYCVDQTSPRFIRDDDERKAFCEAIEKGEADHPNP